MGRQVTGGDGRGPAGARGSEASGAVCKGMAHACRNTRRNRPSRAGVGSTPCRRRDPLVIGSRDPDRAEEMAGHLREEWPEQDSRSTARRTRSAAQCDIVVVATPWEGAVSTSSRWPPPLAGKVVISMVNALAKEGREMLRPGAAPRLDGRHDPGRAARLAGLGLVPPPACVGDGRPRRRPRGRRPGLLGPRRGHRRPRWS